MEHVNTDTDERTFRRTIVRYRNISVLICAAIMALGLAVGLIFFARPTTSIVEKRDLTPFPAPTIETFLDGSFFTQVSLWYADTYPLREPLVAANQSLQRLYGIQPEVKFVGGNVQADEIGASGESEQQGSTSVGSSSGATSEEGSSASEQEWTEIEAPEEKPMQEAMQEQIMNGLYIKGGAAYNLYYFVEDSIGTYIEAINQLADQLDGQAKVYSMLVPNGSAVLLEKDELEQLGGSNQKQAIEYCFGKYHSNAHPVPIFDSLREHRSEYLYFRTDHHWTQLAAYYSYREFCKVRGFEPADMLSWEEMNFPNFIGTFATETGDATLEADTVVAYVPPATNDLVYYDTDGVEYESHVINDVSDWGPGSAYYCFGVSDYPLTHVVNPKLTDGSACLLLKDSYGNCFAPQLVGHYQDLYVIDYRYSDTDIVQFVRDHGITDVIVENNIAIASTQSIADALLDQATRSQND